MPFKTIKGKKNEVVITFISIRSLFFFSIYLLLLLLFERRQQQRYLLYCVLWKRNKTKRQFNSFVIDDLNLHLDR